MSKKLTKQQYLAKKKIKQQVNAKRSQEKTGKFVSRKEKSIKRNNLLHDLFEFAPHNNTMFCEPINKEGI